MLNSYSACNAECQANRHKGHTSKHPGILTVSKYDPNSKPCYSSPTNGTVCTLTGTGAFNILVEGNSFIPNDGVNVVMHRKSDNKEIWSGGTYTNNFGSFGLKSPMRDCSDVPGVPKNNAYVIAWDAKSSKWGKAVDVSTGCAASSL